MNKVIQIGGTVRSGTTLLGLIMANHPGGLALGEVLHLFSPYTAKHKQEIAILRKNKKWNNILDDKPENLYSNIFNSFPEINLITDSSKDPFWFTKLGSNREEYKIERIVTYKTPEGLFNSFKKRNQTNWHKVYLNCYRRWFSLIPVFRSVMINDVLNNSDVLQTLCFRYDLDFSSKRIEYWNKEQLNFFGSPTIKKNKIEIEQNQVDQKLEVSDELHMVFQILESVNIQKSKLSPEKENIENLKYNPLQLKLLKFKDDIILGKPVQAILRENAKFGF